MGVALSAVWALVSPLGSVPDEPTHVVYAAAVVRGDAPRSGGDTTIVPASVAGVYQTMCSVHRPAVTADCIQPIDGAFEPTTATSTAAGYPRLYYFLVGWPTLIAFGDLTWYFMRLMSVLIGGVLLWVGALAWNEISRAVAASIVVAVSPMTSFMLGAVNPAGVEITAAVAFVLAGTGLLHQRPAIARRRTALPCLVLTGAYLAAARPSSYVFLTALAAVLVLSVLPDVLQAIRRKPALAVLVVGIGAASLVLAAQTHSAPPTLHGGVHRLSAPEALLYVVGGLDVLLLQVGGAFGWYDHGPPLFLQAFPVLLVLTFAIGGWATAQRLHERLAILMLLVGATVVGPLFAMLTVFLTGTGYTGRYAMPLLQTLPVLAAALARRPAASMLSTGTARRIADPLTMLPYAWVVLHLADAGGSWLRHGVGLPLPVRFQQTLELVEWVPPVWPALPLAASAALLAAGRLRVHFIRDPDRMPVCVAVAPASLRVG